MKPRPRPFVRKEGSFYRIHVGRTSHTLGDYYTTQAKACDAARRMWNGHR